MKFIAQRLAIFAALLLFASACSSGAASGADGVGAGGAAAMAGALPNGSGGALNANAGQGGTLAGVGGSGGVGAAAGVSSAGGTSSAGANATAGASALAGASGTASAGGSGVAGTGGTAAGSGSGGSAGSGAGSGGGTAGGVTRPCDLYASAGTPCVAAHSTVRALYALFSGALYQVRRASDNTTKDIATLSAGGFADSASQDTFCTGTTCVITIVYDQSTHGNHLAYQGPGGAGGQDTPASATGESLTVSGHQVYSLYIKPGNSYWKDGSASGIPLGSAPEAIYMVTSGTHVNSGCCFDYGNSETNRKIGGNGAMDAVYFGSNCWIPPCSGTGPWVFADLEDGLFAGGGNGSNAKNTGLSSKFVTAMLKNNGTTAFALKGGNAQSAGLTTFYSGALPGGFNPMHKQGALVLGSGGDCCATNTNLSQGTFYEGAIVTGYPSDATDALIHDNIVAAGYGAASDP